MARESDTYTEMVCNITLIPCCDDCGDCKVADEYEAGTRQGIRVP